MGARKSGSRSASINEFLLVPPLKRKYAAGHKEIDIFYLVKVKLAPGEYNMEAGK